MAAGTGERAEPQKARATSEHTVSRTAGKWRNYELYFGASTRKLPALAGHELGG